MTKRAAAGATVAHVPAGRADAPAANPTARACYYGNRFNVSVPSSGRTQYSHSGEPEGTFIR